MATRFPCKQCGKCCTMINKEPWTGISLFPWEKHQFPEKDIQPSLGLGETPNSPDFKTILHTYHSPTCTHLQDKECTIYQQRPLVCKSYPFRVTHRGEETIYMVAPECTTIQGWPEKNTVDVRYKEMDAAELIGDHLSRFYKADEPKWRYSPEQGWTRIGRNKPSE